MPKFQSKSRLIGVYTLGSTLQGGVEQRIDIGNILPPMIDVGKKSVITKIVAKVSATITTNGASPAIVHRYFRYMLDMRLQGPANYPIYDVGSRGWHTNHWDYLGRGFVDQVRAADIPANTASATRTWTQGLDFEEPNSLFPLQKCYAVEAFKAANAGLFITLRTGATLKGTALTITAATVTLYAHVLDVPASQVPIPVPVTRYAVQSDSGAVAPTPGIGKFVRILMVNSPVPADNLDGAATDDMSAYTSIQSFGVVTKFSIYQEDVDRILDRLMRQISVEKLSPLASMAGNSSLFRLYDPQQNSDGLTLAIPLVVPSKGTDFIAGAPTFDDYPRLHANNDSRVGLPGGFFFLCERVDARTAPMLNAYVGALTDVNGKSILGRSARAVPGAGNSDPSRLPLVIDAR